MLLTLLDVSFCLAQLPGRDRSCRRLNAQRGRVSCTFTLHGTSHELTIPMQVHIDGANRTVKTHFAVPDVQWGLKDPSVFILGSCQRSRRYSTVVGKLSN